MGIQKILNTQIPMKKCFEKDIIFHETLLPYETGYEFVN